MLKCLIIGAGAAGMFAAIHAAELGMETEVWEKNDRPGKKLFITGKGRCNLTNNCDTEELLSKVVTNKKFLYSAFYGYNSQDTMKFFEKHGLRLKTERGNRVFPLSDKSSDVIRTLEQAMKENGVRVCYQKRARELVIEDGVCVGVKDDLGQITRADRVLVTCGGLSYATTGSTGDGYRMAEACGHKITPTRPSLVPMNVKEAWCHDLMGLALKNVSIELKNGKKKVYSDFGEMLFTHFGVSGPLILSASAACGKVKDYSDVTLTIDLKPALSAEQLDARLLRIFDANMNKQFRNCLSELLPHTLIPVIIELAKIDPYKQVNAISREERTRLVTLIKHMTMHIAGLRDYNEAIITSGGISVKDINPSTMASKHVDHLYFAGEVIDVDAVTGGFNLQIAWSTAYLAAESMNMEDDYEF